MFPKTALFLILLLSAAAVNSQEDVQQIPIEPEPAQPIHIDALPNTLTPEDAPEELPHEFHSLTEQQKQKLLEEEAIRVRLHTDKEAKISELANLTAQQQQEFDRRLKEEAAKAYERVRQELEAREQAQREERERLLREAKLSKTEERKLQEDKAFKQAYSRYEQQIDRLPHFNDYMFDMEPGTAEDFQLTLPHSQEIIFYSQIYINRDGVYVKSDDLEDEQPLQIYVYENTSRIIFQDAYFFKNFVGFSGQPNTTYSIKFSNNGLHRLVSLSVAVLIEQTHMENRVSSDEFIGYGSRAKGFYSEVNGRFRDLYEKSIIEISNKKALSWGIEKYYVYTIVETVLVAIMCLAQVQCVQKILSSSTVV